MSSLVTSETKQAAEPKIFTKWHFTEKKLLASALECSAGGLLTSAPVGYGKHTQ